MIILLKRGRNGHGAIKIKLYEIRNEANQFIGTKFSTTPDRAIKTLVDEINAQNVGFRRSYTPVKANARWTAIEIKRPFDNL